VYDIKKLHLETTELCQAMCPMCDRVTLDGELSPHVDNISLSLKDVQRLFKKSFIQNLDEMYMCGNMGDPMMAPDCIEIFEYFRKTNPDIYLSMNTNGGARKPEFWECLASLVNHVTFSIDGLEDTNSVYRKGVLWYNVMSNVNAFIKAGGKAKWDYLIFEHNEHQVEEAEQLSKELGFVEFRPKTTNRYNKETVDGVKTYWRGKESDVIKQPIQEKYQSEVINNPQDKKEATISPKCTKNKEIFVSARGHVFPCCWAHTSLYGQDVPPQEKIDLVSMVTNNDAKKYGINKSTDWFESIFERWDTNDKPYICSAKCNAKQDTVKLQYV
jgi:MoaA/NifB/PqqE/SkfB family radical SAM enzyme